MHKFQKTIGLDFDGTITLRDACSVCDIPEPRKNAIEVINKWYDDGYIIVINTLRDDQFDKERDEKWEATAKAYMEEHGIKYHFWNENVPERTAVYPDVRKIAADVYIDDRNLGGIPDDFKEIDILVRKQIGEPIKK